VTATDRADMDAAWEAMQVLDVDREEDESRVQQALRDAVLRERLVFDCECFNECRCEEGS
jgi:hypothetical protein